MSKRFIDTELFARAWFMELPPVQKCAFLYILTNCDCVGVWHPNKKLAELQIGAAVDWEALRKDANGNIQLMPNGKWWLSDFCRFQYGELSEDCRPHQTYIAMLEKHGLLKSVKRKGIPKGTMYPKLRDKEKEKEQDKEQDKAKDRRRWRPPVATDGRVVYPPARCPECGHVMPGHAQDCPVKERLKK